MQEELLKLLYGTEAGRACLKVMVLPRVSMLAGKFLDSEYSKFLIRPFMRQKGIDLADCWRTKPEQYESYNDFFTRELRTDARQFDEKPQVLSSPCDSALTVYPISENAVFTVKDTPYTMRELLKSDRLAKRYEGGCLCVFRLCVDDYHYFAYVDHGRRSGNYRIPGVFHTVNPIANEYYPIYKENTREFSLLKSDNFGTILMMEVGALLVGRIQNFEEEAEVHRGQLKGCFEFGGSTVILAFEKDKVRFAEELWRQSQKGIETRVQMGTPIGEAVGTTCYEK